MNFFEMLIMSRKMNFGEDGKVSIYGQGTVMFPYSLMEEYMLKIENGDQKLMYSTAKEAMLEFKGAFLKATKVSDVQSWICNSINLLGQGKIKYENLTTGALGVISLDNSPIVIDPKTDPHGQNHHVMRGILAGVISAVSEKDIDVIETECIGTYGGTCTFIADTKENLKQKFADLFNKQI